MALNFCHNGLDSVKEKKQLSDMDIAICVRTHKHLIVTQSLHKTQVHDDEKLHLLVNNKYNASHFINYGGTSHSS